MALGVTFSLSCRLLVSWTTVHISLMMYIWVANTSIPFTAPGDYEIRTRPKWVSWLPIVPSRCMKIIKMLHFDDILARISCVIPMEWHWVRYQWYWVNIDSSMILSGLQVKSHYLNQRWTRSLGPYGITNLQWDNDVTKLFMWVPYWYRLVTDNNLYLLIVNKH